MIDSLMRTIHFRIEAGRPLAAATGLLGFPDKNLSAAAASDQKKSSTDLLSKRAS